MSSIDTDADTAPETKVPADTAPTTPPDAKPEGDSEEKPRLRDQSLETQLEVTRDLMRKHERQAKDNLKLYEQSQADLAAANTRIALMQLRMDHPGFTEEDFAECHETDPDAIKAWGASRQAFLDRHLNAAPKPSGAPSTPDLTAVLRLQNATVPPKTEGESPEELRKRYREKYSRRH